MAALGAFCLGKLPGPDMVNFRAHLADVPLIAVDLRKARSIHAR
jgi:hypothetical protein